jgi:hypothetical protein
METTGMDEYFFVRPTVIANDRFYFLAEDTSKTLELCSINLNCIKDGVSWLGPRWLDDLDFDETHQRLIGFSGNKILCMDQNGGLISTVELADLGFGPDFDFSTTRRSTACADGRCYFNVSQVDDSDPDFPLRYDWFCSVDLSAPGLLQPEKILNSLVNHLYIDSPVKEDCWGTLDASPGNDVVGVPV